MKKIFFIIIIFIYFFNQTNAEGDCEYKSQIDRCTQAQSPENTTRSIKDFVCIFSSDRNYRVLQIVLDEEFKKIDKEINKFLEDLEKDKDRFFGKNAKKIKIDPLIDAIDLVNYKFNDTTGEYARKYSELCNKTILEKTLSCINKKEGIESPNINKIMKSVDKKNSVCHELYKSKLRIYQDVSINILKLNKLAVRKDNKKIYQQENRGNYEKLIDLINVNIRYMERIWKKWPSKTKYPHQ